MGLIRKELISLDHSYSPYSPSPVCLCEIRRLKSHLSRIDPLICIYRSLQSDRISNRVSLVPHHSSTSYTIYSSAAYCTSVYTYRHTYLHTSSLLLFYSKPSVPDNRPNNQLSPWPISHAICACVHKYQTLPWGDPPKTSCHNVRSTWALGS